MVLTTLLDRSDLEKDQEKIVQTIFEKPFSQKSCPRNSFSLVGFFVTECNQTESDKTNIMPFGNAMKHFSESDKSEGSKTEYKKTTAQLR
jgi:hypothetical protein